MRRVVTKKGKNKFVWALALVLPGLVFMPMVARPDQVRTTTAFLFYLLLSQCISLSGGRTGYLSLGQGMFVGLGAYGAGLLVRTGFTWWAAIPLTGIMGVIICAGTAPFLFRLGRESFALANLAMVYVLLSAARQWRGLTGGTDGLYVPGPDLLHPAFMGMLLLAIGVMVILIKLPTTRLGYRLELIGTDFDLAESVGVPRLLTLARLHVLSSFCLTLGGGVFMMGEGYIIPSTVFGLQVSLMPVAMAMVGGLRNPFGPFLGTFLVFGAQEWLWSRGWGMEQTLMGILLIAAGRKNVIFPRILGLFSRVPRVLGGIAGYRNQN